MAHEPRTAAATAAAQRWHAEQSASDPRKLSRALRVVRAALELHTLTLADVFPGEVEYRGDRAGGR